MDIIKDIKELSMAAGIADTFHGRDCCSALDRLEDYIEELRKERDELALGLILSDGCFTDEDCDFLDYARKLAKKVRDENGNA